MLVRKVFQSILQLAADDVTLFIKSSSQSTLPVPSNRDSHQIIHYLFMIHSVPRLNLFINRKLVC